MHIDRRMSSQLCRLSCFIEEGEFSLLFAKETRLRKYKGSVVSESKFHLCLGLRNIQVRTSKLRILTLLI